MAQRLIYPDVIRGRMKQLGMSGADLARAMGLTRNNLSRVLTGKRDLSIQEARSAAQALQVPFEQVLGAMDAPAMESGSFYYEVSGLIHGDDRVEIIPPVSRRAQIPLPFTGYDGLVLMFATNTYAPRFLQGEFIGVLNSHGTEDLRNKKTKFDALLARMAGREVFAGVIDDPSAPPGSRKISHCFKRLQVGVATDRWTLLSLNPAQPPILDANIAYVADIDWHLPRTEFLPGDHRAARQGRKAHVTEIIDSIDRQYFE